MNRAIFLDRDGTINEGFNINKSEDLRCFPFAAKALKIFKENGYLLIVVTNQGGVSLGYMSEDSLDKIHNSMNEQIYSTAGVRIDKIYSSFYHKNSRIKKYLKKPNWRKPEPGMLLEAAKEFNIDLKNSWMIGDRPGDIEAGKNAGTRTLLVLTGHGEKAKGELQTMGIKPTLICKDLLEAAKTICDMER